MHHFNEQRHASRCVSDDKNLFSTAGARVPAADRAASETVPRLVCGSCGHPNGGATLLRREAMTDKEHQAMAMLRAGMSYEEALGG